MYGRRALRYFLLHGIVRVLPHEAAGGLMVDREDGEEDQLLAAL